MIMKKVFNSLFVIIAAMVTFAGCQKEENNAPATPETKTVQFFAESIETKTHFGEKNDENKYPTLWDGGDKVKVLLNLEQPEKVSGLEKTVEVEVSEDSKSARFVADINSEYTFDSYTFYAVAPSSAYNAKSSTENRFTVLIPDEQTPLQTSVDMDAQVLYAVSTTTEEFPSSVQMNFKHFTAYGKLSLANLTDKVSAISSIRLSFEENVVGKWNYFVADGSIAAKEATNEIVLNTTSTENIWFACAPVDMSGKKMTVTANTDKGPLSKEVILPANRKFESGKISVMAINMAGIEPEEQGESDSYYEKVTAEPEDWSGKYLIVWGTNAHATLNGKDLKSTCAVTIVENKITANDAVNATAMTVTKSGNNYNMTYPDGKYFAVAHNSSSSSTSAFTLSFAYTASGVKISGQATNSGTTSTYILYNNNNQYYRCYVDKSNDNKYTLPSLYKLVEGDNGGETPEEPVEPDTTPSVKLETEKLELTAEESEGKIPVEAKNIELIEVRALPYAGSQEECDWLVVDYDVENSCVTYLAAANETEEPREAYIEVYCLDADANEIIAGINVTQEGVVDESELPAGIASIYDAVTTPNSGSTAPSTLDEFSVSLTDAIVTYVNGNSAFLEDATGGILIYKSGHGLVAGNKLNGILTGKGYVRYGVCQITEFDMTNITKEEDATIPCIEITVADLLNDYATYVSRRVKIVDATVTDGITGTSERNGAVKQNGSSINLYNNSSSVNFVETEVVDFYAYPSYYSTTKQLATWEAPTTKKVATPVITCTNNVVTITCGTSGTSIYYAIGDDEFTAYSTGVEIDETVTIKAYATKSGLVDSEIVSQECEYVDLNTQPTTTDATLSFANKAQRTSFSTSKQVWEQNEITFTNDKSSSTSNVADYANPVRLYANSKVTIDAPGNITKIVFDANSSSYATAMKNSIGTPAGATVTVSSDKVTVTIASPNATSFVVAKLTAQVRLDSITVTYEN